LFACPGARRTCGRGGCRGGHSGPGRRGCPPRHVPFRDRFDAPFGYDNFTDDPYYDGYFDPDRGHRRRREKQGNVEIKVSPKSASVSVNGLLYGRNGQARFNLPAGTWSVELQAPGYVSQKFDLEVRQGEQYRIERKLEAVADNPVPD
jgi:hypothetical protein